MSTAAKDDTSEDASNNVASPQEEEQDEPLPTIDEENGNVSHHSHASSLEVDGYKSSPLSAYPSYRLRVDHSVNDRATELKLFQLARPHMRAFHCAWFSFFLAFYLWFAIAPLLNEIQVTLNLSKENVWTSSICSDAAAILDEAHRRSTL